MSEEFENAWQELQEEQGKITSNMHSVKFKVKRALDLPDNLFQNRQRDEALKDLMSKASLVGKPTEDVARISMTDVTQSFGLAEESIPEARE